MGLGSRTGSWRTDRGWVVWRPRDGLGAALSLPLSSLLPSGPAISWLLLESVTTS